MATTVWFAIASSVCLFAATGSGCGGHTLSRSKAKELLEPMVNRKQWTIEFGGAPSALRELLLQAGLIAPGNPICPVRLTDAGKKEYSVSHWECRWAAASCGAGGSWVNSCTIPLTTKLNVEVTGIRFDDATHALVEYTTTGVLSIFGQTLQKVTHMAGGLSVIATGMVDPRQSRAAFELYDDGWRTTTLGQ